VTIAHDVEIVATAVSARRAVMAEVSGDGFVTGFRLLTDTVKGWDTRDFEDRPRRRNRPTPPCRGPPPRRPRLRLHLGRC
jgi:hypothetical protein